MGCDVPDIDCASALGQFGERWRSVISDRPFDVGNGREIAATVEEG